MHERDSSPCITKPGSHSSPPLNTTDLVEKILTIVTAVDKDDLVKRKPCVATPKKHYSKTTDIKSILKYVCSK